MVRLQLLGSLELRASDGRSIQSVLAQPRRTALLAYLAAATPRGFHRRDTLLGLFWPETPAERARRALNQSLYTLRTALGRGAIISRGEEVALDDDLVWCDAAALVAALAAGRAEEACELYRGEMLPGFFLSGAPAFEHWLDLERLQLRSRVADAAWALAEREEAAGRKVAAGHWGRRSAALMPEHEPTLRRLMIMLARLGDATGAIAAYEVFTKRLADEYELAPSAETQELVREVRAAAAASSIARPTAGQDSQAEAGSAAPAALEPATMSRAHGAPPVPPPAALPALHAPAVGREAERAALKGLLRQTDCRLVTVTGPGGIGKTHLALQVAAQLGDRFADGVRFVPLATVRQPADLAGAIARTLDVPLSGERDPERQLLDALAPRQMLLVLDNFDHLVEGADLVSRLLARAPRLRLLVTSREALNIRGESIWPLSGLRVPEEDHSGDPERYGAVQLFVQAARRAAPSVATGPADMVWIGRICRLVEGMPLAIELAAAWLRVLSCEELFREIEKSYAFLAAPLRDLPERHRSLRVSFETSWSRLGEDEQSAFRRLVVFEGGFEREAALHAAAVSDAVMLKLVDRSLLRRQASGRFELLEILRHFALEAAAADLSDVRERHCAFYARLVQRCTPAARRPWTDPALRSLAIDAANIRQAWRHAVENTRLAELDMMIDGLYAFHDIRGWHSDGERSFDEAVASLQASDHAGGLQGTRVLARLLARQGAFRMRLGDHEAAHDMLARSVALARAGADRSETALSLDRLGVACYNLGRFDEARGCQEEGLRIRRELEDTDGIATSLNNLGSLAYALGDHADAHRLCMESLMLQRQFGDVAGVVTSLQNLGWICLLRGEERESAAMLGEALAVARSSGSQILLARALCGLGNLANARGTHAAAAAHFADAYEAAVAGGAVTVALDVLVGLAVALARTGRRQTALQLLAAVMMHEAAGRENRHAAQQLMIDLKSELPPDYGEQALDQAHRTSLPQLAEAVRIAVDALRA